MRLTVNLQYTVARKNLPAKSSLQRWARAALKGHRRAVSLGVRIVGAKEAAALNARFRRKKYPTNVLAFPYEAPPGPASDTLGDLVICAPLVRREASQQNKPLRAHWAHMVVHGILHLRGFDHQQARDAAIMEKMEIRLLKELGFANPYIS
ncbi:MAG: rRNA maturation RNase YbeY [Gammaproteobacteria bacterium]|nr:rRNA maturation RNase YbeY [Gammaproteobacteria bacterium]